MDTFNDEEFARSKKVDAALEEEVLLDDSRGVASEQFVEFVSWLEKNNIPGPVLDIGYVGGPHTILLAQKGFDVYVLDSSQFTIAIAAKNAKAAGVEKKVRLQIGDVFDLPFDEDFFSVANDDGCLHHTASSNWRAYISNMKRVLKVGGVLHVKAHCVNSKYYEEHRDGSSSRWILIPGKEFTYFFDEEELKELFKNGFSPIKIEKIPNKDGKRVYFHCLFRRL